MKRVVFLLAAIIGPVIAPPPVVHASSPATGTYYIGALHFTSQSTTNPNCASTSTTHDYDLVLRYDIFGWSFDAVGMYQPYNCDGSPLGPRAFDHRVGSFGGPPNADFLTNNTLPADGLSLTFTFSGATAAGTWDFSKYGISEHAVMALTAMTPSSPIVVDVIDPMCQSNGVSIADQVCPGSYVNSTGGLVDDLALLRTASVVRRGAVADGVTKLLVRVHTSVPVMLQMHADTPQDTWLGNNWGILATRDESVRGDTLVVRPEGNPPMAFAIYQSPVDMPASPAEAFRFSVTQFAGASSPVKLYTPMPVLIHGVWSEGSSWASLQTYLRDHGYPTCDACRVDYGHLPNENRHAAGSFDPTAGAVNIGQLAIARRNALAVQRGMDIAATQVDVVAHSMGGLVTRARAAQPTYRNRSNFFQGDFHKLITVGTPHRGSPLADWIVANKCATELVTSVVSTGTGPPTVVTTTRTLEQYLESRPLGNFGQVGAAIYGLQTGSPVYGRIGYTAIWSHPIIGRAPVGSSVERLMLGPLPKRFGHPEVTISGLLGGDTNHDTIVPVASEQDGITVENQKTTISGIVHASKRLILDRPETDDDEVFGEILRLLRDAKIGYPWEFNGFFYWGGTGPYLKPYACPATPPTSPSRTTFATPAISPAAGTVVHPGDVVPIQFSVTGGEPIDNAVFSIGADLATRDGPGPFSIDYHVPATVAGRVDITVETNGPGAHYAGSTFITVVPTGLPVALSVLPPTTTLVSADDAVQLTVTGTYSDGSTLDLTSATAGTVYTVSAGAGAVTVTADGLVHAQSTGTATISAAYGGLTATAAITVALSNHPPALAPIDDVDLNPGPSVAVPLTATDPDGDAVTLTGVNLPALAAVIDNGAGHGQLLLSPAVGNVGTYTITMLATDTGNPAGYATRSLRVSVSSPGQPAIVVGPQSQTVAPGQVAIVSVVASGTVPLTYQWFEGTTGDTSNPIGGALSSSYIVPPLSASKRYWVRVSNDAGTANSNSALLSLAFTDPYLFSRISVVRATHVIELRARVDALRATAGLGAYAWTNPIAPSGLVPVRAQDISDLRTALAAVYAAKQLTAPAYTDPVITPGFIIKAAHIVELRAAVLAVE